MELNFGRVEGLPPEEQQWLQELKYIYDYHRSANRKKRRYYNGKVTLNEVNLGIALPGEDEETCKKQAEAIMKFAKPKSYPGTKGNRKKTTEYNTTDDAMREFAHQIFGKGE